MPPRATISSSSRVADVAHKAFVAGLAAFTIYGAVEVMSEVNFLNRRRAARWAAYEASLAANGDVKVAAAAAAAAFP
jgi:predicted methyltransferase MtxX (methanogen marker protein 4)